MLVSLFDSDGVNIVELFVGFDVVGRVALGAAGVTVGDFMPSK